MLDAKSVKAVETILKGAIESSEKIESLYPNDPATRLGYQVGTLQSSIQVALLYLQNSSKTA